jgi:hypothetical protein
VEGVADDDIQLTHYGQASRYVAGWMIAHDESDELARQFIEEAIVIYQDPAGQLTIHADRGRVLKPSRSPF